MSIRGVIPLLVVAMIGVTIMVAQPESAGAINPYRSIWLTQAELESLPMSGPAWNAVVAEAEGRFESPDISDNSSDHDTQTFAAALVAARTGDSAMRQKTVEAISSAIGTESGGNTLALSRNLVGYVLAADLIDLPSASPNVDARFREWLNTVRRRDLDGRTLISTHDDRPNNWGTHAGASRMAAALYLGDATDFANATRTFKGLLGDRSAYSDFRYGDLDWQADRSRPVGINPAGATINGHSVDGVLPDDQRRGGDFAWPPPCENYVREAMQGMVVQAEILRRQGQDAFGWSDRALLRAAKWLTGTAGCEFEGDDEWIAPLLNAAYGTSFPVSTPVRSGKHVGFTDWTHSGSGSRTPVVTTTVPATTTTAAPDPTEPPATETTALRVSTTATTTTNAADTPDTDDRTSACTITGTDGPDVINGTDGDDVICGLGGDDTINAGRGNDIVFAGPGDDTVYGDRGRDILNGEDGNDFIDGGRSNDYIDGGAGDDTLDGGSARDTIVGGGGDDEIHAGSGHDIVMGGDGDDVMNGEDGDDFLDGGAGANRLDGGDDDNMCAMTGGARADTC